MSQTCEENPLCVISVSLLSLQASFPPSILAAAGMTLGVLRECQWDRRARNVCDLLHVEPDFTDSGLETIDWVQLRHEHRVL